MNVDTSKWLWVDLEMTGLDPMLDRVIEVAAIVTDQEYNELAIWHSFVRQPEEILERMKQSQWYEYDEVSGEREHKGNVYDMHVASGVIDKIDDGAEEAKARKDLAMFITQHFDGSARLAGNSIHQDRRFFRQQWPETESLLHYRMLDVSSLKMTFAPLGVRYEKDKAHNALDDIRASIDELKFYIAHVKKSD